MKISSKLKILIVDDSDAIRSYSKHILRKAGFKNIHEANDGKYAIEKLESSVMQDDPFDLLICDWNMPMVAGIDVLKYMKQNPGLSKTAFIMATAENEAGMVRTAIESGVHQYMLKPLNEDVILKKNGIALEIAQDDEEDDLDDDD